MNVLFVCSQNRWRSLTAEKLLSGRLGISVQSVGTATNARIRVTHKHIDWADVIFVMEQKHKDILSDVFKQKIKDKNVIVLNIPDNYKYMDKQLIEQLEQVNHYLEERKN